MNTIFMNSENNKTPKTPDFQRVLINLTDKIDL